jgi:hypothetical protein
VKNVRTILVHGEARFVGQVISIAAEMRAGVDQQHSQPAILSETPRDRCAGESSSDYDPFDARALVHPKPIFFKICSTKGAAAKRGAIVLNFGRASISANG